MIVSVGRSPLRALGFALLVVPMILLAVDMAFSHRWYPEPDSTEVVVSQTTDESGSTIEVRDTVLTNDGKAQRRRDLLWAGALGLGGLFGAGVALRELFIPRRVVSADQMGLHVRIFGSRRPPVRFAWSDIAEVRSGVLTDTVGTVDVLSLRFVDPGRLPEQPVGAVVDSPWLHLFAEDWDRPPHVIAPIIEGWVSGFGKADQYE